MALGKCSLGTLLVAVGDDGICAIDLDEKPEALVHRARRRWSNAAPMSDEIAASRLIAQVARSIEAPRRTVELPLDPQGTRFQRRVWRELSAIPAGRTTSYSDIARRLGSPGAARAVAAACAANKLAVAIPCHRVVRNDGTLAGYRWGAARKRELLAREATAR
ncbi:MAG: methylated-DNA--[protein]-cysteine S-methyltransferase [Alphaproteobacteria bacterium]